MAYSLPNAVRIVAPGPKGFGTVITDVETGTPVPKVRDISIYIPVDDLIRAYITCYVSAVDVIALAKYSFVASCPECGHIRVVTPETPAPETPAPEEEPVP